MVYPRLAEIDVELEQHAEEEHDKAKELIDQIRAKPDDVAGLVQQLQQAVHLRPPSALFSRATTNEVRQVAAA